MSEDSRVNVTLNSINNINGFEVLITCCLADAFIQSALEYHEWVALVGI